MPRSIVTWYCNTCNTAYPNEEEARKCEQSHFKNKMAKTFFNQVTSYIQNDLIDLKDKILTELGKKII